MELKKEQNDFQQNLPLIESSMTLNLNDILETIQVKIAIANKSGCTEKYTLCFPKGHAHKKF